MWPIGHLTGVPLQRPPEFGDRRFLTDEELGAREQQYTGIQGALQTRDRHEQDGHGPLGRMGQGEPLDVVDRRARERPAAAAHRRRRTAPRSDAQRLDGDRRSITGPISTTGIAASRAACRRRCCRHYNNGVEILQSPGYVVFRLEMIHEARVIPTDGRARRRRRSSSGSGESRGRWEGNTLVVETTNFNGQGSSTNIGTVGSPPSTRRSRRTCRSPNASRAPATTRSRTSAR